MKKTTILFLVLFCISGCTVTGGNYGTQSHFSFPNSNVKPIGQVQADMTKWGFLVVPNEPNDVLVLLEQALAQKPGSDLLLNYSLDSQTTSYVLFVRNKLILIGTAAQMNIGKQKLNSILNEVNYKKQSQ